MEANKTSHSPLTTDIQEMSDLAKLQAEVIDKGLVRESRPVFIYDKNLAKEKKGNAARQEKHREKLAASGLKSAPVPVELIEKVKQFGGGKEAWDKVLSENTKTVEIIKEVEKPIEIIKEVEVIKEIEVIQTVEKTVEVIKEVPAQVNMHALELGEKVLSQTGIKSYLVRKLLGI